MFKEIFENIKNNLPKQYQHLSPEEIQKEFLKNKDKFGFKGPIMTGFNITLGPDGKPRVSKFGNIKMEPEEQAEVQSVREPLVEVIDGKEEVIIIAEMPGVSKEDIQIKATSKTVVISTKSGSTSYGRNYYKEIDLPAEINSDYAKARYTNGILEVKLKKLKNSQEQQKEIKID
ncbi:MAG: archaeal heat shock protein Hsp20 [Promethearchaeota archaeon]